MCFSGILVLEDYSLFAPLPHPQADGQSTLWHLVQALWGQARCVEFTAPSLILFPSSLPLTCWQADPRGTLGAAERLARSV